VGAPPPLPAMMDLGHSGGRRAGWRAWGSFFSLVLLALAVLSLSAPKPDSLAMTTGAPDGALQEFAEVWSCARPAPEQPPI
jgi:hypothetical protein